jgi:aminomethyltransferase
MQCTPLFDLHQQAKARLIDFAGWSMPVQYAGIVVEHQAVRSQVGVFDVSHMAKWQIMGQDAIALLQQLVPSNLARLQPSQGMYTLLLNPQGGIIDDVIVYRGEASCWLISNCATYDRVKTWLASYVGDRLVDLSSDRILLAVQGQKAVAVLRAVVGSGIEGLHRFAHGIFPMFKADCWIARTGYTGEDGFEIMLDVELGRKLWQELLGMGVMPCGLGCRDTLRLEAGLHLYGQDMDENTTPLEAGLGWLIHWAEVGDFVGRSPLASQKEQGIKRKLVGIEMQGRAIARHGYPIQAEGQTIGTVTSGSMAPTLNRAIAMGYVPTAYANLGQELRVLVRDQPQPARVVPRPFYRRHVA